MLRAERQWTQEYVAFEGGLTQTYLSELERGTRNPSIGVLEKLATVFGVPPARCAPTCSLPNVNLCY